MKALRTTFLLLLPLLLSACEENDTPKDDAVTVLQGETFGTFYRVTLPGERSEAALDGLKEGIEAVLEGVDAAMSTYRDDSEINRISATAVDEWVTVSEPLYRVLTIGQEVAGKTGGALDITVGALVRVWGFGPDQRPETVPSTAELRDKRAAAGYQGLELDDTEPAARRRADFELDVSAVAKGYGIDAVARFLDAHGIEDYLVNIGGDMRAGGRRSDERPWRVGVQQPDGHSEVPVEVVPLEDMAITTSGDYRNYFEEDGRRYSHLIDPRTGRPIDHRLASVTILHRATARADAYATGLMVLGPEEALAVAEQQELKALLIVRDGDGFTTARSSALERYLEAGRTREPQ